MFNDWVNSLEWVRVRPWLFLVGSVIMCSFQIEDIGTNNGWSVALDWLALALFGGYAIHSLREGLRIERARRIGFDGAP